jgi:hypothetical protein
MDASLIQVIPALAGTLIGGATTFLSSWVVQRRTVRAQSLGQDILRREDLYNEFIEEASKCYADAIQHDEMDIPLQVVLYAKMSRMRVVSSPEVIDAAEHVVRKIVETYSKPSMELTAASFRAMSQDGSVDLLRTFSEACRAEFDFLRGQQF